MWKGYSSGLNVKRVMALWKGVWIREHQKIREHQHLFNAYLILLANALPPGVREQALACQLPLKLVDWSYTEEITHAIMLKVRRCKPGNALKIKSANYLHSQAEQLTIKLTILLEISKI